MVHTPESQHRVVCVTVTPPTPRLPARPLTLIKEFVLLGSTILDSSETGGAPALSVGDPLWGTSGT